MRFLRLSNKNKNKVTSQPLYLMRVSKARLKQLDRSERKLYKQLKMSGMYQVER